MPLQSCLDTSEAISLEPSLGLYLKPVSKIKINVQLPKLNLPGQSISSWHVMEKIKETVRPDTFLYLKALKITMTVIKFEGELETKASCDRALARLRGASSLKLSGFADRLQIRAAHAASSGPNRHDWEAFFRDAKGVNEMKPGERPDTIHLEEVPLRWFVDGSKSAIPSDKLLHKAFGTFGKIRRMEVPPKVTPDSNAFGKTGSLHNDLLFEVYIQYEEYVEFAIAMDSLRDKKLLYKEHDGKVYSADIKVDFDRNKYLSDKCIQLRAAEKKKRDPELPSKDAQQLQKDDAPHCSKDMKPQVVPDKSLLSKSMQKSWQKCDEHVKEATFLLKSLLQKVEISKRCKEQNVKKSGETSSKVKQGKGFTEGKQKSTDEKLLPKSDEKYRKQVHNGEQVKQKSTRTHSSEKRKSDVTSDYIRKTKSHSSQERANKKRKTGDSKAEKSDRKAKGHNGKYKKEKHSQFHLHDHEKHKKIQIRLGEDEGKKMSSEQDTGKFRMRETELKFEEARLKEKLIEVHTKTKERKLLEHERVLKEKLLRNLKAREKQKLRMREELRKELAGRKILTSVLGNTNNSRSKKR